MVLIPVEDHGSRTLHIESILWGGMVSTYRVPLLDSNYLGNIMHGTTALKVLQDLVVHSLHSGCYNRSFWTLNTVEPHLTYPNLYLSAMASKSFDYSIPA